MSVVTRRDMRRPPGGARRSGALRVLAPARAKCQDGGRLISHRNDTSQAMSAIASSGIAKSQKNTRTITAPTSGPSTSESGRAGGAGGGAPGAAAGEGKPCHEERAARDERQTGRAAKQLPHPRRRKPERDDVAATDEEAAPEHREEPARGAERLVGHREYVAGGEKEPGARDDSQRADDQRASPVV